MLLMLGFMIESQVGLTINKEGMVEVLGVEKLG